MLQTPTKRESFTLVCMRASATGLSCVAFNRAPHSATLLLVFGKVLLLMTDEIFPVQIIGGSLTDVHSAGL
jgi:hypothetical protein